MTDTHHNQRATTTKTRLKMLLRVTTSDIPLLHTYIPSLPHFCCSRLGVGTGHDFSSDTGVPLPNRPLPRHSMFPNLDLFIVKMGWDVTAVPTQAIAY